ncbi:MAG TPA: VOC family protein [Actinophytocola sp.]|jgi:catechol 2,3-dioxygenase-like lactoylglutathione lyase family enzyme|nr:VOC family protein [Actinophytocola sp.]
MKLTFLYQPVKDLAASVAFYRDTLGLDESWREGDTTAAFSLPGTEVELMLDVPPDDGPEWGPGGFYTVENVEKFVADHAEVQWVGGVIEVPGGRSATFLDPSGNCLHLVDQSMPETLPG